MTDTNRFENDNVWIRFVFPWFPSKKDAPFGGSMGFAPYSAVFHVFLSPPDFLKTAVENTIAHEVNHTVYFTRHPELIGQLTVHDDRV